MFHQKTDWKFYFKNRLVVLFQEQTGNLISRTERLISRTDLKFNFKDRLEV